MKSISDIMTRDVTVVAPTDNVQRAAELMRDLDVGSLPVCNGKKLVGIITDRDITLRSTAEGKSPADVQISDIMTDRVLWCFEDQTAGQVLQQMGDEQIRRIPVVNRDKELIGIVALGDLATRVNVNTDSTLEEVSTPSTPDTGN